MLNKQLIRTSMQRAISVNPTVINLKRYEVVDDGLGGYSGGGTPNDIATFDAIFNISKSKSSLRLIDAGQIITVTQISLTALKEINFSIQKGDIFTVNDTVYKISQAIPMYDTYWKCEVEVNE